MNRGNGLLGVATAAAAVLTGACGESAGERTVRDADPEPVLLDAGAPEIFTLDVRFEGDGVGRVTGAGGFLDCSSDGAANDCTVSAAEGTAVTLTAETTAPSRFGGWSGVPGCGPELVCELFLDADLVATASFLLDEFVLSVARDGNGTGQVTSASGDVDCGEDCATTVTTGTEVVLTAVPAVSSVFDGWSGACGGDGGPDADPDPDPDVDPDPQCTVVVEADAEAVASFSLRRLELDVRRTGNGAGVVTGEAVGIDCGDACAATLDWGTTVTLVAAQARGSAFAGWTGCDAVDGATCEVTLADARTVEARFNLRRFPLTVTRTGTGQGSVSSEPAGIDCGDDCEERYRFGTDVVLTATPDAETSRFAGWAGDCGGGGPTCETRTEEARNVEARFALLDRDLGVSVTGGGTVTATGIDCGGDCSETYPHGTEVTLTATPLISTELVAWGGACAGATGDTCTVRMTGDLTASVTFRVKTFRLDLARSVVRGAAGYFIYSGALCLSPSCTRTYAYGTDVDLRAIPFTGSLFDGWSGDCSGTGSCTVTMTENRSVTGTFTPRRHTLTIRLTGGWGGEMRVTYSVVTGGISPAVTCTADCSPSFDYDTEVQLSARGIRSTSFLSFAGCDSTPTGSTCRVRMTRDRTVTARFLAGPR
jgi:hypothetical protein